jgi:4-hydroxy-tetrahydrodipicolinate synthase
MTSIGAALGGISGVHATPYNADGAVDVATLQKIVAQIGRAGVHAIVTGGNTGEYYALTPEEVRLVQETAIAANEGRSLMIAAVGRSLREAIAAGMAAKAMGADLLMAHQPLDPFAAPQAQARYFLEIAEAVDLPLVAYVRSSHIGVAELAMMADHANIPAVKFAVPDLQLLATCINEIGNDSIAWICGLAESWAPAFYATGATGFTSGLVNIAPRISLAVHAALQAGDFATARRLVAQIAPFEKMRTKFAHGANVTVVKEAMALIGMPMGPVRAPGLERLDATDAAQLATLIESFRATGMVDTN